jgi:predicted small secreted protein
VKTTLYVMRAAALPLLSARNTVKGMGQDLQKAGEKIESAAKK